ncbi:MAG: hypothetical protein LUD46_20475 [Parabacteroides sp.]|nr:hypothetical protein [Parabacteroides sp.]
MKTNKPFPDGGTLNIEYTGSGNGSISYSSTVNEGLDREIETVVKTTKGAPVEVSRLVKQAGKREKFNASDGEFILKDGGTFNVLKDGLQ